LCLLLLFASAQTSIQDNDPTIPWNSLAVLVKSGLFTKTVLPGSPVRVIIGTTLIWVAAALNHEEYAVLEKDLLMPWSGHWRLHEHTVLATALLRMQLYRHVLGKQDMTLLELRPGAMGTKETLEHRVCIPQSEQLRRVSVLSKHHLCIKGMAVTSLAPGATLQVDVTGNKLIDPVATGGVIQAADDQPT
jgi:hypothetical protein